MRDWIYAARSIRRQPLLSAAAVLCLALGLGCVIAVFSVLSQVVLAPLPYPDADRVVMVWNQFVGKNLPKAPSSGHEFEDHRRENTAFDSIAGFIPWNYNLADGGEPLRVEAGRVSAALFPMLGVDAAVGRVYNQEEEDQQARLVVLSHGFWQRRYGGDAEVLGRSLELDGIPFEVIGVLPEDFFFPLVEGQVWVPFTPNPAIPRRVRGVRLVARVKSQLSVEQAQQNLDRLVQAFAAEYPDHYPPDSGFGMSAVPLREELLGDVRPLMVALQAAVALVLLIACANVANLLLAQAAGRGKELALRSALGARVATLRRQLLLESLLLALPGGLLGLGLAWAGLWFLRTFPVADVPRLENVSIDASVALFGLLAAVVTGVLCGLAPAWRAAKVDLVTHLREGGKTERAAGSGEAVRRGLVIAEVALAVAVLIITGLTVRSFQTMTSTDPGFRSEEVLTARLDLSSTRYRSPADRVAVFQAVGERLASLPGASAMARIALMPPEERLVGGIPTIENRPADAAGNDALARYGIIGPEYFETMQIPLLDGRAFTLGDDAQGTPVAVVDSAFARRWFSEGGISGSSALGQRIQLPGIERPGTWRTIVGVVGSVRSAGQGADVTELVYVPYLQLPQSSIGVAVAAAPGGEAEALAPALREAVWAVDPAQPISALQSMEDRLDGALAGPRFQASMFSVFGLVALLLAALGVYGLMAHAVMERRQEIGMRRALGAQGGDVARLVLRRALVLTLLGAALGVVLAAFVTRIFAATLDGLVYGVGLGDPLTYLGIPLLLVLVALISSLWPLRRALAVDPLKVLRQE
ncbi:MAG: ABC transporter permease [Acidobacteriota bacterium]